MSSSKYFRNTNCKYFPCHKGIALKEFSCLFCFCPLYCLEENCGGNFRYADNGIKDCSGCTVPHRKKNYDYMIEKSKQVIEKFRKNAEDE